MTQAIAAGSRTLRALCRLAIIALVLGHAPCDAAGTSPDAAPAALRVCADPANLPYSNDRQEGFENRIAALLAADLHAELRYFWFAEHRSFFRRTLLDGMYDVVISVPVGLPVVATTAPYFASSYVAVIRARDARRFGSFDDAWLRDARIGLQLVGAEGASTPPAVSLAHRGVNQHITPFAMWASADIANPQGEIIDAVADGRIDVALVWGPFGGHFAKPHADALRLQPILADPQSPDLRYVFPMALGVRKTDLALRDRLQSALDRHHDEIDAILADAGIPTVPIPASPAASPPAGLSTTTLTH